MQDQPLTTDYEDVPYPSFSYPQTHPDRLATLATLFGLAPAPVDRCRVLEIGCASGGNLIPMAEGLPDSRFVGIDLSAGQIAAGRATVADLRLTNIDLHRLNILDLTPELGRFDYVIAHGVYSWVPAPVRDKLLAVCRNNLASNGVAYVSYNTYPGWHGRGAVRDMMGYHTRRLTDPKARAAQARALLSFLARSVPVEGNAYGNLIREEEKALRDQLDAYLLHDQLEAVNEPVYLYQFVEHTERAGLRYLGEADMGTTIDAQLPPQLSDVVAKLADDLLGREQYLDFLTNRMFRQTLLCHREVSPRRPPRPEHLALFRAASRARCLSAVPDLRSARVEEFRGPKGPSVGTDHAPTKAAFLYLAEVWPLSVPLDELQAVSRARLAAEAVVVQEEAAYARDNYLLAENLLQAFLSGVIELHLHAPPLTIQPGRFPRVPGFARRQARERDRVTNLRHEVVPLDDVSRHLFVLLDGSRDREALVEEMQQWTADRGMVVQRHGRPVTDAVQVRGVLAEGVEAQLQTLARASLLMAD
jgi:SAM-dependent methyltransferase